MNLTPEKEAAFIQASKPLMKYLAENCHPHATVIVSSTNAELLEGILTSTTEEFLRD